MKLLPGLLRADFTPSSYNEETKTITVICTTDTPVVRWSWDGQYNEVLSMDKEHVRLERFLNGAPLLNSHSRYELRDIIGVVKKAWIEGNKLMAEVQMSDVNDEEKHIVEKVKAGIIRNLSIGYKIFKVEETKVESGQIPTLKAIDWEPYEVSFVPVPADHLAVVRSENNKQNFQEVEIINSRRMEEITNNDPKQQPAGDPTEVQRAAAEKAKEDGVIQERKRVSEIADCIRAFNLSDAFKADCIEKGYTIEKVRELAQIEFAKQDPNAGSSARVKVVEDEADKERSGIESALVLRSGQIKRDEVSKVLTEKDIALAGKFRSMSLLDLAKWCLIRSGVKNVDEMDKMQLVGRAITSSTSDFPVLLEGTNRRVLLASYNSQADRWREFCDVGSVSDFREVKRLRMGTFSKLDSLDENGEYKTKKITDADFERASIETKGNIINLTRKMIINDDLSGFTKLASMLGRAAARSIEIDAFKLLTDNPEMEDGVALFHADHGNLIDSSAGAPTVERISAMRQLMQSQKDKDGNDFIDVLPYLLLTPLALGDAARVVNTAIDDPDVSNKRRPNIARNTVQKVIDTPRLTGTEYYMFANPSEEPVLQVNFLDGVETPFMESHEEFTVDGMKWKIRHDYGVSAIGFKGAVKTPGA